MGKTAAGFGPVLTPDADPPGPHTRPSRESELGGEASHGDPGRARTPQSSLGCPGVRVRHRGQTGRRGLWGVCVGEPPAEPLSPYPRLLEGKEKSTTRHAGVTTGGRGTEAITLCSGQNPRPARGGEGAWGPLRVSASGLLGRPSMTSRRLGPRGPSAHASLKRAVQGGHLLPQTHLLGSSAGETPWNVSVCSKVN